jgi:hypothetical protein
LEFGNEVRILDGFERSNATIALGNDELALPAQDDGYLVGEEADPTNVLHEVQGLFVPKQVGHDVDLRGSDLSSQPNVPWVELEIIEHVRIKDLP